VCVLMFSTCLADIALSAMSLDARTGDVPRVAMLCFSIIQFLLGLFAYAAEITAGEDEKPWSTVAYLRVACATLVLSQVISVILGGVSLDAWMHPPTYVVTGLVVHIVALVAPIVGVSFGCIVLFMYSRDEETSLERVEATEACVCDALRTMFRRPSAQDVVVTFDPDMPFAVFAGTHACGVMNDLLRLTDKFGKEEVAVSSVVATAERYFPKNVPRGVRGVHVLVASLSGLAHVIVPLQDTTVYRMLEVVREVLHV